MAQRADIESAPTDGIAGVDVGAGIARPLSPHPPRLCRATFPRGKARDAEDVVPYINSYLLPPHS